MLRLQVLAIAVAAAAAFFPVAAATPPHVVADTELARGRFLVMYGGCNDCHTPAFGERGGHVAQAAWLTGSNVGFRGPWGTTYPTNLRLIVANAPVSAWLAMAHAGRMRPPMPAWALQTLTDADLRAMYAFIKSLGTAGPPAPAYVPPGRQPHTPSIHFVPEQG